MQGKVYKDPDSEWWVVENITLDIASQGKTRKEALEMIAEATELMLEENQIKIKDLGGSDFLILLDDTFNTD